MVLLDAAAVRSNPVIVPQRWCSAHARCTVAAITHEAAASPLVTEIFSLVWRLQSPCPRSRMQARDARPVPTPASNARYIPKPVPTTKPGTVIHTAEWQQYKVRNANGIH